MMSGRGTMNATGDEVGTERCRPINLTLAAIAFRSLQQIQNVNVNVNLINSPHSSCDM